MNFWDSHHNVYKEEISVERMKGAKAGLGRLLCEIIKPPQSNIDVETGTREPLVCRVLDVGPGVNTVKPDDLVSISYLAGCKISYSNILTVFIDDVEFIWGDGLKKE